MQKAQQNADVSKRLLDFPKPLTGMRLPGVYLSEVIGAYDLVALQFLRHLGCVFCKNAVDGLYRLASSSERFPPVVFVHQSPVEEAERFFEQRFPGAPHISDVRFELYEHFGVKRSGFFETFADPRVLWKLAKLTLKGYKNELGKGDVRLLSATFLFYRGRLKWKHLARFPGDDPFWERLAPSKA
ncbi:MAG: hypothetical protein RMM53_00560 [Bacteroidia bacterium]|nr:hypothetical protein [Bacteroidia bacterium]MDW8332686.1 hypothetical protein [Bacteroidia bacterium]